MCAKSVTTKPSSTRVLIVDDEMDVCEALAFRLKREKYQTETAPDVARAIECLKNSDFDLVLCDYQMPEANGLKLLEYCQSQDKTPFVLMSAYSSISRDQAISLGASDFLEKPFTNDEWIRRIAKILRPGT